jgi:predicted GNAT family N-acyltransferase
MQPSPVPIVVKVAEDPTQYAATLRIRQQVFVEEQGVPATLEVDGYEGLSTHFIAYVNDEPVGCGRFRLKTEAETFLKFERIATLPEMRGKGVGAAVMSAMEHEAAVRHPGVPWIMHAQTSAATFYDRLGWRRVGPLFSEAGIWHIAMRKDAP